MSKKKFLAQVTGLSLDYSIYYANLKCFVYIVLDNRKTTQPSNANINKMTFLDKCCKMLKEFHWTVLLLCLYINSK